MFESREMPELKDSELDFSKDVPEFRAQLRDKLLRLAKLRDVLPLSDEDMMGVNAAGTGYVPQKMQKRDKQTQ